MATVCKITLDAAEYKKELDDVVARSKEAQAKLSGGIGSAGTPSAGTPSAAGASPAQRRESVPRVEATVTADTATAKAELNKLENTPVKVEAEVNTNPEALNTTRRQLEQTGNTAQRTRGFFGRLIPDSLRTRASEAFGAVREEMTKTQGGAGTFLESVLAGGGAIGIIMAGVTSVLKLVTAALNAAKEAWLAHVQALQANSEDLARVGNELQKTIEKEAQALSTLRELNGQESLSNTQKNAAAKAVRALQKSYHDLNIEVDAATGKLKNFDTVNLAVMKRQTQKQLGNVEAQIRENSRITGQTQDNLRRRGFFGEYWEKFKQFYGFGTAEEDSGANKSASDKNLELRRQRTELIRRQKEAEEAYRAMRRSENDDLQEGYQKRTLAFEQRKSDDAFSMEKEIDAKIANRRKAIEAEQNSRDRIDAQNALRSAESAYAEASKAGDQDRMLSAEQQILLAKQAILSSDEKIYAFNQQIASLKLQQQEVYDNLLRSARNEVEYNALFLAGEHDKAAALKLEQELKERHIKLTKEEKEAILEQRKAVGSQNLGRSLQDEAFNLYGQAMTRTGREKEFAQIRALRDAERTKGGSLTGEETELVKSITALTYQLAHVTQPQLGDLSIRSNSLTARGGFSSGAVLPDKDAVNKVIAKFTEKECQLLEKIQALSEKINATIERNGKV